MRRGMLEALIATREAGEAAVLLTPLDGSPQRLLKADGISLLEYTDQPLAATARQALAQDRALTAAGAGTEVLAVPHNPPLRLVIIGAVHIAESLCRFALEAGYAVTVIDPRSAFVRPERFPGVRVLAQWPQEALAGISLDVRTAVVLLTHDPKVDDPALRIVLQSPVFYVGALGSTRTHARRLERLAADGLAPAELARIHGPAGLSIGARTPAEIALSVLAQMTQVLREGAK